VHAQKNEPSNVLLSASAGSQSVARYHVSPPDNPDSQTGPKESKIDKGHKGTNKNAGNGLQGRQGVVNTAKAKSKSNASVPPRKGIPTEKNGKSQYALSQVRPVQANPNGFKTIEELLKEYPDAVSIEIRISKGTEYESAISYYQTAFTLNNKPKTNDYSTSWAFKPTTTRPDVEFLVINTSRIPDSRQPKEELKNGIIGYTAWPKIRPTAMDSVYNWAIKTAIFETAESPGKGPQGPRDNLKAEKKTVRAILKKRPPSKPNTILSANRAFDGVIINPPVP
jgi:hypothetical protein